MSQEMTQVPAPAPIKSVPIWGAIKEGVAFPFIMDREKARVFGLHMLLMTLSTIGFLWALKSPGVHAPGVYKFLRYGVVMPGSAVVFLGTLVTSRLYTAQRIVLGCPTAPYTRLWRTSLFAKLSVFYLLLLCVVAFWAVIIENSKGLALILMCPGAYMIARFTLALPDVATRQGARLKDGWHQAKGHVFEIFLVSLVFDVMTSVICVGIAVGSWFLFVHVLVSVFLKGSVTSFTTLLVSNAHIFEGVWSGLTLGLITWILLSSFASLSHLYVLIRVRRLS